MVIINFSLHSWMLFPFLRSRTTARCVVGWSLCLMIDESASEVANRFCGYMCYQLSSKSAEFHIARIAVIPRTSLNENAVFHDMILDCFSRKERHAHFVLSCIQRCFPSNFFLVLVDINLIWEKRCWMQGL